LQIPHDLTPFGNFVLWHVNDDLPACVDRYSARRQNGVRSYKIWEIFPKPFRNAGAIPAIPESDRHTQLNSGAVSSKAAVMILPRATETTAGPVKFLKVRKYSRVRRTPNTAFSQYLRGDLIDVARSLRVLICALR
jgi:hypothetical protein